MAKDSASRKKEKRDTSSNDRKTKADNTSSDTDRRIWLPNIGWKLWVGGSVFIVTISIIIRGYFETRINTPFSAYKATTESGLAIPDRYWGAYRPNVYFGMKTRDPNSLITGIMWYFPLALHSSQDIRHWCEQSDDLKGYGWIQHDGKNFGIQRITDKNVTITTSFVKRIKGEHGGDWTARITFQHVNENEPEIMTLLVYTALDNKSDQYITPLHENGILGVRGSTPGLGNFKIKIPTLHENYLPNSASYLYGNLLDFSIIKETIIHKFRGRKSSIYDEEGEYQNFYLPGDTIVDDTKGNLMVSQISFMLPFSIDIVFESASVKQREQTLSGDFYLKELKKFENLFSKKFEEVFGLREKGFSSELISFAEVGFSNLIGGIGYFSGSAKVQSDILAEPVSYWKASLYTAVPSRSFFPRGFLWDEGFHGLVISPWDLDIELDIMTHWFDLMNVEGWIPREVILGEEAVARVPKEFIVQKNTNANPPAFFLTLRLIMDNYESELRERPDRMRTLKLLYPRFVGLFNWLHKTQGGQIPGSYRWRGRKQTNDRLNAITLTSGMDDYPRASHPSDIERHLDLRCWMAFSVKVLIDLSYMLNEPFFKFSQIYEELKDNDKLDLLHWSEKEQIYGDYGLHTDAVKLEKRNEQMKRKVMEKPEARLIDSIFGYNSLFPLIFNLIEPSSPKLEITLRKLRDEKLLWTLYGLRSISKSCKYYRKFNSKNDPPYWRGNIWMNVNYLVLKSLKYYQKQIGPYSKLSFEIYKELRKNIIDNIFKEYKRTGYFYEHYNDEDGKGGGSKPFNGWTSVVVLIMAEIY